MNKKVIPFPTLPLPELPVGTRVMSEWTLHVGKQRFGFELSCQALNPAPKLFVVPAPPKSSGSGPKKRRKRGIGDGTQPRQRLLFRPGSPGTS